MTVTSVKLSKKEIAFLKNVLKGQCKYFDDRYSECPKVCAVHMADFFGDAPDSCHQLAHKLLKLAGVK